MKTFRKQEKCFLCDSTSSLDRFNTSVFIISTSTPTSAVPLGVLIPSDEQLSTIKQGLEMLAVTLPQKAFSGNGARHGLTIVMIDDSSSERGAIQEFCPAATFLLCTFHFLQSKWTWLHDGKNHISKNDRVILINMIKELVYAQTKEELARKHQQFLQTLEVKKYPHFLLQYIPTICYICNHTGLADMNGATVKSLIQGNHTNNYAEAGMCILKELIFSRVKAHNLVQNNIPLRNRNYGTVL